jgi:hypothetical protein
MQIREYQIRWFHHLRKKKRPELSKDAVEVPVLMLVLLNFMNF